MSLIKHSSGSSCVSTSRLQEAALFVMLLGVSPQVLSGSSRYHVSVCSKAAADVSQGKCKDGAVCMTSGSGVSSFGSIKEMKMNYSRQDETVILQYTGGDRCPPGEIAVDGPIMSSLVVFLTLKYKFHCKKEGSNIGFLCLSRKLVLFSSMHHTKLQHQHF